jgi:ferric enterobactin receptor
MENNYVVTNVDEAGVETVDPDLKNIFLYDENIQAAYAILGNKSNKFTYQAGLRVEYTDVRTRLVETNEQNPRDYLNFFPSAHLTYAVANQNSFQLSYSRRIRRPFYNDLSPFVTLADGRNFFSGNPDLDPEYTDAYEIGHLKYFEKGSLTSSFYYRDSKETIDRIRVVDDQGNARTLPQNLIGQKSFGLEFTSDYNPYDWWKLDLNFNFFHAEIDGTNIIDTYKPTTYSWFARQTSRFSLPGNLDIQLRGNFEAPQKTTQGTRKALAYIDLSFAKEVLKGNGTLNLNIMDVFNSRVSRYTTEGPNFFTEGSSQFRRRQINLTLNYRIRQSKSARRKYVIDEG